MSEFIEIAKGHLFSIDEASRRKLWAGLFVTEITGVARAFGYGMFHGGSLVRDIDLVAIPWSSDAISHVNLVLNLCRVLNLKMGNHGETLAGHRWYALWQVAHRDHQIDLKIILPVRGES